MTDSSSVTWQPITQLPIVAQSINEMLEETEEQYETLYEARDRPHVLDDEIIDRVVRLYSERIQYLRLYRQQLDRWKQSQPTEQQVDAIRTLNRKVSHCKDLSQNILDLAVDLRKGTIDRVMEMDEVERALKTLTGELKPPWISEDCQLTPLTTNRSFMREFIEAEPPCFALGMIEERQQQYGLLTLRPKEEIPAEVTNLGLNFGHSLFGNNSFEVIHFVFQFYGFQTFNVLVNPNNLLVQTMLTHLIDKGDYFFLALNPNNRVTTFRAEIGQETLSQLKANLPRIQQSSTTDSQYRQAVTQFAHNPDPEGVLLDWVCHDDIGYLDLTEDRVELSPA